MLKFYREKRGMTQEELARQVDVSTRTIQNIERSNNTNVHIAIKIAKILKHTVEEIFEEKK